MNVEKDIVFHDKTTTPGSGEIYSISKQIKEIIICISGTSSSRTVEFKGATFGMDAFCPITGFKEGSSDFVTECQTIGNNELWRFDITGLEAIQFPITAVYGGYVTIKGRAVG